MEVITTCIVEDQPLMRKAIEDILLQSDKISTIGSFRTAEELLTELDALRPDTVLMDLDLPGMPGIKAIEKVKEQLPSCKILVLTVFIGDDKIFEALKSGADGYLLKKQSFELLNQALIELKNDGAPMSPEVAKKVITFFHKSKSHSDDFSLTQREKEVLSLIVKGYLYKEIADKMGVTIDAIKKHAHNIYEKLQVRNRTEVARKYLLP